MKKLTLWATLLGMIYFTSCGGGEADTTEETTTEEAAEGAEATEEAAEEEAEEASIVGAWKLSEVDMGMEIPEEQKEMFDQMIQAMIDNTTMTFNDDGSFESKSVVMGEERVETGTYTFADMVLTSTNGEGQEESVNVKELTSDKMMISVEDNGNTMSMTFIK